jgi:hypothetical protein
MPKDFKGFSQLQSLELSGSHVVVSEQALMLLIPKVCEMYG